MANGTFFDSYLAYQQEVMYNGATAPNPANFFLILCITSTWGRTDNKTTVIGTEVAASLGYARAAYNPGTAVYDSGADQRSELPLVTPSFAATGGTIQWDAVVLIRDAISTRGDTTGDVVAFYKPGATQSIPDGGTLNIPIQNVLMNTGLIAGT